MIIDMRIYTTNNIIDIRDIYTYTINNKGNTLVVITQKDTRIQYDLREIVQTEVITKVGKQNWIMATLF